MRHLYCYYYYYYYYHYHCYDGFVTDALILDLSYYRKCEIFCFFLNFAVSSELVILKKKLMIKSIIKLYLKKINNKINQNLNKTSSNRCRTKNAINYWWICLGLLKDSSSWIWAFYPEWTHLLKWSHLKKYLRIKAILQKIFSPYCEG